MSNTKNKQDNSQQTIGCTLLDGTLLEMVYDPRYRKSQLIVKEPDGREIQCNNYLHIETGITYIPFVSSFIEDQTLILPTKRGASRSSQSLMYEIRNLISCYMDVDDVTRDICANYVIFTYLFDGYEKIPFLQINGVAGSGKTRLQKLLSNICYHGMYLGSSLTSSNLYRINQEFKKVTLLTDELDFNSRNNNDQLAQILNDANQREGNVFRGDHKDHTPTKYNSFGPKILATKNLDIEPSLKTRMLRCILTPTQKNLPLNLPKSHEWEEAVKLRNDLLGYRLDNFSKVNFDHVPSNLLKYSPRMREMAAPLVSSLFMDDAPGYLIEYLDDAVEESKSFEMASEDYMVASIQYDLKLQGCQKAYLNDMQASIKNTFNSDLHPKTIANCLRLNKVKISRDARGSNFNPQLTNTDVLVKHYGLSQISEN